jgi:hypothetical protein
VSRRHHKQSGSTAERAAKLKAHKAALIARTGFVESDPRIEQGAWLLLAEDVLKESLLRGETVPLAAMQPVTDMLASILPVESKTLTIAYLYRCQTCLRETENDPEPTLTTAAEAKAAAAKPVHAVNIPSGELATAVEPKPAPPAPLPNVMPLRSVHNHVAAPTR